jgi:very-short-patch-repair endonuclease
MSPEKLRYYHAQAAKVEMRRKWQWMATWPIVHRWGDQLDIRLEHPCGRFRIDLYVSALNLAIEVDEPHHGRQVEADAERQALIEQGLGCTFRRLRVEDGEHSLYVQLDHLFEEMAPTIEATDRWEGPATAQRTRVRQNAVVGDDLPRKDRLWNELVAAGVPELVQSMLDDLAAIGVETSAEDIRPLNQSNGDLGFIVLLPGLRLAVSVTKTRSVKTLVVECAEGVDQRLGLQLSGPNGGSVPYWNIAGMRRHDLSIEQTLRRIVEFRDILTNAGAQLPAGNEA